MRRTGVLLSILVGVLLLNLSVASFAEGKYEIKEMTPAIKTALENRKDRFNDLKALKAQGSVGENNRGYVEALKNDAQTQQLVDSENQDRKLIYKAIEEQNNLNGALETIEKVFAQVQRDKANPGDKIQDENGNWVTK